MGDWIKRGDGEPTRFGVTEYYFPRDRDSLGSPRAHIAVCDGSCQPEALYGVSWTHWRSHEPPPPPPRTVTIEISEEDARAVEKNTRSCPNGYGAYMRRIGDACRKALEAKR